MENYENITHNIHEDSDHIQKMWRDKGEFLKNTQKNDYKKYEQYLSISKEEHGNMKNYLQKNPKTEMVETRCTWTEHKER